MNASENDTFRPAKVLSYIVTGLFGGIIICALLYIAMSLMLLSFPGATTTLGDGRELNIGYAVIALSAGIEQLLRLAVIVLFLIWEYQSFKNLSALKAPNLEFSPGWAVGWWFVPLANLVKPFQAIRELWNESDPDFDEETVFNYSSAGTPALIIFWWIAFLLSNIANSISNAMVNPRTGLPTDGFPVMLIVVSVFQITAAGLAILIVRGVTQRQEQRFSRIVSGREFLPPPPNFYENR